MYLYTFLVACPFEFLTQSLYIWNHYGKVLVTVVVAGPIVYVVVVVLAVFWIWFIVGVTMPSFCGPVPWVRKVGCWKLPWPCMLVCCKHCFLLQWNGYCPSVHSSLYVLAFCKLWWWECCWVLVWLWCLRREEIHLALVPQLWIVYFCPVCWCAAEVVDCVLPSGWTKMSSTNLSHKQGMCWAVLRALTSNSSINKLAIRGLMGEPLAAPWTCS